VSAHTEHTDDISPFTVGQLLRLPTAGGCVAFDNPTYSGQNNGWNRGDVISLREGEHVTVLGGGALYVTPDGSVTLYIEVLSGEGVVWVPGFAFEKWNYKRDKFGRLPGTRAAAEKTRE
jgi:hypothetical protein